MEGTCHKVPNRSFLSPTADCLIRFLIGASYHQQLITYDYIYGSGYVAEYFRSSNCFSTSFTLGLVLGSGLGFSLGLVLCVLGFLALH